MGNNTDDPTYAYDANGNIKKMVQFGWKVTGSSVIDDLQYNYSYNGSSNTNKLLNVIDFSNDAQTKLGDFRTSLLHPNQSKNSSTIDYTYDNNGNLKKDLNKDIGTASLEDIAYNYLNLPQTIIVRTTGGAIKGTITYTYDAAGNKIQKVMAETGQSTKTTLYLDGAVYENDIVQSIAHEEGRIRYNPSNTSNPYPYDYFIKDHLGNTRMVLTEETQLDQYPQLTFEDVELSEQNASWENANGQSINVAGVRTGGVSGFNSQTGNGSYVRLIKKSTGAIGAGKLLKVMAGDRIHTKVDYYYTDANANNNGANPLNSFVSSLTSVFGVNNQVGPLLKNDASTITTQLSGNSAFTTMINPNPNSSGGNEAPKAYLNILFFDDQFKFDAVSSIVIKVNYSPNAKQTIDRTFSNAITANKSGYVYLYFSNESETQVWFDNLTLTHERSSLVQESHYYPFGLLMAGISSKAVNFSTDNKKNKFQEQELIDDLGVNYYEFKWRTHDPQIGRFIQIDPLTDKYRYNSTYAFSENKVVVHRELEGLESLNINRLWTVNSDELQGSLTGWTCDCGTQAEAQQSYNNRRKIDGVQLNIGDDGMIINDRVTLDRRFKKTEQGAFPNKLGIVLHRTQGSSVDGAVTHNLKKNGGFHFIIDKDGTITQLGSLNFWLQHVGAKKAVARDWKYSSVTTIGIEHVGRHFKETQTWEALTEAQIESSAWLVKSLMRTYNISAFDVVNHEDLRHKTPLEGAFIRKAIQPFIYTRNRDEITPIDRPTAPPPQPPLFPQINPRPF